MSVNEAWKGRRFKSDTYKVYQDAVTMMLPKMKVPEGELKISLEFGFSSRASDIDNCVKQALDILCKKYGFNDNSIYQMILRKVITKKNEEYFAFKIESI